MKNNLKPGKDHIGVGAGVLILNDNDEVLLKKRGQKSRNEIGWWEKSGGLIEFGEKILPAVRREVKEELNVEIEIIGYFPHTDHIITRENQHWVAINYLAKIKRGKLKNMEPHKCEELKWFNLDRLPKKIVQPTRESIRNYLAKRYIEL